MKVEFVVFLYWQGSVMSLFTPVSYSSFENVRDG